MSSDKLFFKGRQDPRLNHVKSGFSTNPGSKAGSKKFPLALVVTNEERKKELEAQVAQAGLFADIVVDTSENAAESINELTIVLNKQDTVVLAAVPGRNDPCVCGSGKKYKKCCA